MKISSLLAVVLASGCIQSAPVQLDETTQSIAQPELCSISRTWVSCGTPNTPVSNTVCVLRCDQMSFCGDCEWIGDQWWGEDGTTISCPQVGPPRNTGNHMAWCQDAEL